MNPLSLPVHDPVLIFALVMLIVLVAPLAFIRLRLPGLVGLILCGAVVGPAGLGILERDATMVLLGTVGLLYLMFVAGLALDLNQFARLRQRSITFGLLSFFIPQGLGILASLYLLHFDIWTALLLGSIVGSHTLLAYPVADRLGITRNVAIVMTMGGTIVTDLSALLLLAVVVGANTGSLDVAFWVRFVGLIAGYAILVLAGLPRVGRWFLRNTRNDPNLSFVFLVTALFITAYLADLAGLAPIIGAFMAGIVLNRLVPEMGTLMSRVKFVGEALFVPFFLLSVGMLVDFGVLVGDGAVWSLAAVLVAAVLIGKAAAAGAAQWLYGLSSNEGRVVFGLSIPQAAATLAVTLVGFDLGLLDRTFVNAVIVLILITCMLGPWLVERYGRRVALQDELQPYDPLEAPQRILIPLSNPATSASLVDMALAIRRSGSDEPVFPLAVVRDDGDVSARVASGERLLGDSVLHAIAADAPVTPMTRVDMNVAQGITRAITERRISQVVIGWGGTPSPSQRVFGSVLDSLLDLTRAVVMVCRLTHPLNVTQRVILAVPPLAERESGFDEVLRIVGQVATRLGAGLTLVAVQRNLGGVKEHLRAAHPNLSTIVVPIKYWSRLMSTLSGEVKTGDLLVLLSARETQKSWQPSLDRLPRAFRHAFPESDFCVIYGEIGHDQIRDPATERVSPPNTHATLQRVTRVRANTIADALREMIDAGTADGDLWSPELAEQIIQDAAVAYRAELAPGVVLIHLYHPGVLEPMLFLGSRSHRVLDDASEGAPSLLLLLVNPEEVGPEQHLQSLANLARAVRRATVPDGPDRVDLDRLVRDLGSEPGSDLGLSLRS